MRHIRGRIVEVHSLDALEARLAAGATRLEGWQLVGLDLTGQDAALAAVDVEGATFLGCTLPADVDQRLRDRGAIVFPRIPDVPVDTYRAALYSPDELYDTPDYPSSLDARAYAWSRGAGEDREARLAQALHDHAIDEALADWVAERRVVGVMGGHALTRGEPGFRDAALLGHALGAGLTVATGGGPGAMEAANLGAWATSPEQLDDALAVLAAVPSFRPDIGAWVDAAQRVRRDAPVGRPNLGIPTWHYGHEPPNAFASAIAKYFANATREAILMQVCDAGIVFLPGAGGTVQEIFADACENYYADESSVAPMVLVGRAHWTEEVPAWPLLEQLAAGRPMEGSVYLVDTIEEAAALVIERAEA